MNSHSRILMLLVLIALMATVLCGCFIEKEGDSYKRINAETIGIGVVVHGYETIGWIKNTNDFPVRVKHIWRGKGEFTQWIKVFQPGEIIDQEIRSSSRFYVLTMAGGEIGFIKPTGNGQKLIEP